MSITTQPIASSATPAAKSVSLTTLFLSLALAVCATAAVLLALLYFRPQATAGSGGSPVAGVAGDEPYVQKDTVSPQKSQLRTSGTVHYAWPYAATPNLKLTSSKRMYDIVKEDEMGFTWSARVTWDDVPDDVRKGAELNHPLGQAVTVEWLQSLGQLVLKPGVEFEDFTWEAKGVKATKETLAMTVYPQEGSFQAIPGMEGHVNFEIPYAVAPHIDLELNGRPVVVIESRPTGFKWKDSSSSISGVTIHWKAKGIRATELPKANSN
jgi:hypothetical protein